MKNITIKTQYGKIVIRNVLKTDVVGEESHHWTTDTDWGINTVYVTDEKNVFVREYNTQGNTPEAA